MANGDIIAKKGDDANDAWMLIVGKVIYEPSGSDTFNFSGSNMIIGASELILENEDKKSRKRNMTIREGDYCKIKQIDKSVLLTRLTSYNIGFNIAKNIASNLVNLHSVVNSKNNKLNVAERLARDYCKVYATTIFNIEKELENKNVTYFDSLVAETKKSQTFLYGESLIDQSSQAKFQTDNDNLSSFKRSYPSGSVIMKEGDEANEMYILSDGRIGVYIQDKQIDTIKGQGQIIGEMGFILNKNRTATLIADEETSLIVVDKSRIKSFFESNTDIFLQMVVTLAKREEYLCGLIAELDELASQAKPAIEFEMKQVEQYKKDITKLYNDLKVIATERRVAWVTDILENLLGEMKKLGIT